MENKKELKKLGILGSFAIYIPATVLIYCLTKYLIPYLSEITGQEIVLFWFIVGSIGIFTPLIITAILILRTEGYKLSKSTWVERLRFRKITKLDLVWGFAGLILIGIFSVLIMKLLELTKT